ncbi:hypothetical protein N7474_006077 [Penicillium riverlandense]|uniref:uncharacterized protein n=1 Tax=Penicillium riverlandense TaxID=1903569 RepID=UPI00254951F0|nr:uncharacterized protein N7474_006077 [Penicillium riverlandense]KAJ5820486.1 hypothetical protein N7474_006077 [Penicillium riverlandense]
MNAECEKCDATGNAEYAEIASDWDSTAPSATVTLGIVLQSYDDFVDVVFDKLASRVMSSKFGARETRRLAIAAARKGLTVYIRPFFLVADLIRLPRRALRPWKIATKGYHPIYQRTWMAYPIRECGLQTGSARQQRRITIYTSLLLSIVAITSCLPGIDRREINYGTQCAQFAQRLIVSDLGRPTILKAQALLLMIRYHMWTGIFTEALMLMGTLTRFAFALRLNYENPNICSLAQESRRRLMWGIYILDTMLAGGLPEFTLCPSNVMHVYLPSPESNFELDIPGPNALINGATDKSTDLGLLAYYIRVMSLRDSILRYTKQAASSTQDTATILNRIGELDSSLQEFALHLPDSISFSEKNFHLRAFSKSFPRYIMIHIWWHQCHCDLYRCFLANLRESLPQRTIDQLPQPFVLDCQAKGLQHARAIADICSLVTGTDPSDVVLDMETAECAYQAGRILIHATQTHAQALVAPFSLVTQQLNSCILFIKGLAAVFPTVSTIANDLSTLLQRGNSLSISSDEELPEHCAHARPAIGSMANRSQIISKHSMLNRSQLTDDSALEDMPFVGGKQGRAAQISTHNSVVDGSLTSPTLRSQTPPRRSGFIPMPQEPHDALMPMNTVFGDPNSQEGAWWNQTNAFEGAWDVAVFHPMSQYQEMWPPLELFNAPSDLPYSGV